jgi:cell division protein FtsX
MRSTRLVASAMATIMAVMVMTMMMTMTTMMVVVTLVTRRSIGAFLRSPVLSAPIITTLHRLSWAGDNGVYEERVLR